MPRFTEEERQYLQQRLLDEGERLFVAHGLKKVAVDDLVQAVRIAKGSFYSFYQNKEHLYMAILVRCQERIWQGAEEFLRAQRGLPPRELTKRYFHWLLQGLLQYPILLQTDSELIGQLYRKLPAGVIEAHTHDDAQMFLKLEAYGVRFTRDLTTVTKAAQILAVCLVELLQTPEEEAQKQAVLELLLEGFVTQVIEE